jgi:hypothetical protein
MAPLSAYCDKFPNARLTRSKTGVLKVPLHTGRRRQPAVAGSLSAITEDVPRTAVHVARFE